MKTIATLTVLAAAAFVSIAAQAQTDTGLSRNAVTTELQRARSAGELDHAAQEIGGPAAASVQTRAAAAPVAAPLATANAKSRYEVKAELARARANGELDWATAETYGVMQPAATSTSVAARR
ncbi:DUF4148 domain-containing protein [Rivibacter subsaxonicus]|uniref:Uncharacterized protein DUF4148 n=1 Tax=Rivibacter subsaxonicus TaxID=457575 RepID=A0A4Q7VGZ0_9BURK|nr:DUF4148 domain-containing protein [Rivibacter subsaxonicus]RZT95218.1 uncharacterized protein DUF4148 [Rivibacter subsaxonicus]